MTRRSILARLVALSGALLLAGCGGPVVTVTSEQTGRQPVDRFERANPQDAAIHAIGIYEARAGQDDKHEREDVIVDLQEKNPDQPLYLALSAYEPVRWLVTGPGAAQVQSVYLDGHYRQTIEGIGESVRVYNRSGAPEIPEPFFEKNMGPDREKLNAERAEWRASFDALRQSRVACALTQTGGARECDNGALFLATAERLLKSRIATFTGVANAQRFTIASLVAPGENEGDAADEGVKETTSGD